MIGTNAMTSSGHWRAWGSQPSKSSKGRREQATWTNGSARSGRSWTCTWKTSKPKCGIATRKRSGNGKARSAHTAYSVIQAATSLWDKWFVRELKICPGNRFQDVPLPKVDKITVRWASDAQVDDFHKWLAERFGAWDLPAVFMRTKTQTGCRVQDLCSLRSSEVRDGTVTFGADTTKGRKGRTTPVSPDLFRALERIKGRRYVWEDYPKHLKKALKAKGWPSHQLIMTFDPDRMLDWVMTLFTDYNADRPDSPKLLSHMLRKRAFTLARVAGIDARDAAIAFGCNPDTMAKHYVYVDETQVTAEVARKLSGILDTHTTAHTTSAQPASPEHANQKS
jgi:integrase